MKGFGVAFADVPPGAHVWQSHASCLSTQQPSPRSKAVSTSS
jgi:hypothetical protein